MVAPKNTPWTPFVVEKASELWNKGFTLKEIVARCGYIFTVEALRTKASKSRHLFPARMHKNPNRIEVNIEPIAKMWAKGLTSPQIAAETGLKASYIRTLAQRHRQLFPSRGPGGDQVGHKAKRPTKPSKDPELRKIRVQHMPLPPMGTWAEIELDDYEKARLPGVSMAYNDGCKYPLTDTGPHCFCAAPRFHLKPYCAYHVVKCNPPGAGTDSEKRAHKVGGLRG